MHTIVLNVNDTVFDKIIHFLKSLPKSDVSIVENFDYIEPDKEAELRQSAQRYKDGDKSEFVSFDEVKWLKN